MSSRAAEIFSDALEVPEAQRAAFVAAACAGDAALRAEVESLLAALPPAAALFDQPIAFAADALAEADPALGRVIGPWRIVAPLATGGMGAVYRGERIDAAFDKQVAIKLLRPGFDTRELLERFRRERQVLARLEHPHIARLLDGGSTPEGQPYLVMEFVDGLPLDRWCNERQLSMHERLARFLDVCDAVQFAHRSLVIHRDLKPANILVDRDGRVKLLDFGIAKLLDDDGTAVELTRAAARVYSPRYASPEQIAGAPITTATDVYSLGVVLDELLASAPPRGDLATIVQRARAAEPERRYGSVQEFADDLRRYLRGDPVRARPDTAAYRVSRFAARNRGLVAGVAVAVVALIAGLAVTTLALRDARRNAHEAEWLAYSGALAAAEASVTSNQIGEAARRLAQAPAALRDWEWRHLAARLDRSTRHWHAHALGITRLRYTPDGARVVTASMDGRVVLWDAATGDSVRAWGPFGVEVESVVPSPDGRSLAIGLGDGRVLFAPAAGGAPRELGRGDAWPLVDVAPDGSRVVAGFQDGSVRVWDAGSGAQLASWQAHDGFALPQWSPRGDVIATGGGDAFLRLWTPAGAPRGETHAHDRRVYALAWSRDATRLVTGSMDRTATVWDAASLTALATFADHAGTVAGVAFTPDGSRVLSSGADGRLLLWDATSRAVLAELRGHLADVSALDIAPDGNHFATGDWSGDVRVWRADAQDVRGLPQPREVDMMPAPTDLRFAPRGSHIAAVTSAGHLLVWDAARGTVLRDERLHAQRVAWGAGDTLFTAEDDGALRRWTAPGSAATALALADGPATALDVCAARGLVATAGADSAVHLWRAASLAAVATLRGHAAPVRDVAFSPDGRLLASAGRDSTVRLWDVASGRVLHVLRGHAGAVLDVAFAPRGDLLASASRDGTVRLWDVRRGAPLAVLADIHTAFGAVAFSPDGRRLAAGSSDQMVRLFDIATRRELVALHGHRGAILALSYASDGVTLASSSGDGTIRLWEAPPAR